MFPEPFANLNTDGMATPQRGGATAVAGFSCSEWPEVQHEDDCSNNGNLHKEDGWPGY